MGNPIYPSYILFPQPSRICAWELQLLLLDVFYHSKCAFGNSEFTVANAMSTAYQIFNATVHQRWTWHNIQFRSSAADASRDNLVTITLRDFYQLTKAYGAGLPVEPESLCNPPLASKDTYPYTTILTYDSTLCKHINLWSSRVVLLYRLYLPLGQIPAVYFQGTSACWPQDTERSLRSSTVCRCLHQQRESDEQGVHTKILSGLNSEWIRPHHNCRFMFTASA